MMVAARSGADWRIRHLAEVAEGWLPDNQNA